MVGLEVLVVEAGSIGSEAGVFRSSGCHGVIALGGAGSVAASGGWGRYGITE